jgi:hypothetical protein
MTVDKHNRLWVIKPSGLDHERSRLVAFDLNTNAQIFEYWFPFKEAQFAQDLRVTRDAQTVILADTGLFRFTAPALIVFDIGAKPSESCSAKTRLHNRKTGSSKPKTDRTRWALAW